MPWAVESAVASGTTDGGEAAIIRSIALGTSRSTYPRIIRKFLTESKISTAQAREIFDHRDQSAITDLIASSACSTVRMNWKPLCAGRYFPAPQSSVITGLPIA